MRKYFGLWAVALAFVVGCSNEGARPRGRTCCAALATHEEAGTGARSTDAEAVTRVDAATDANGDANRDASAADSASPSKTNPIVQENAFPGTSAWKFNRQATNHEVEGYASATSAAAGETVSLFVNVSRASSAHWELYRLGYYGGLGGRFIGSAAPVPVSPQTACPPDPKTGLVECAWTPTFSVTVDPDWVTGYYLFKLIRDDGFEGYVPLVIRESVPRAPLLMQANVATWQAYNQWGGSSLYTNQLPAEVGFTEPRAFRVSFDRPYQSPSAADTGPGDLFLERWMFQWLEMKGYDVAYATSIDVDGTPNLLAPRRLFVIAGHDEYWSLNERLAVDEARDQGVSLAFFSANTAYWETRLDASSSGVPRRVITCYKGSSLDPEKGKLDATGRWRDNPLSKPENALIGQMYELWSKMDGFPLLVTNASHWIYDGTLVKNGDTLSHLVGDEWDHVWNSPDSPPSLEIMAHSDAFSVYGSDAPADMTVYCPTPTSLVFSAGSIEWVRGLGAPGYADDRIGRIAENVIARAGLPPTMPTLVSPPRPPSDVGNATKVAVVAGTGVSGYAGNTAGEAEFASPAGVAADSSGNLYVTESRNHLVRKITPDGTVSTLAGCGPTDTTASHRFKDATGMKACFNVPTGIAVGPDGLIYVSDSLNQRIRRITPDGVVTTFAGSGGTGKADATNPLAATFSYPRGLAFGPDGALFVADAYNGAIRRIGTDGVTTVIGGASELTAVAVGSDGTLYVVGDTGISMLKNGTVVPVVNPAGTAGDRAGPGVTAMLRPADGLAVDGNSLVVSDTQNYKVRRIALSDDHTVTTLAGDGRGGTETGSGATAHLVNPRGLVVTASGIVVADTGNHRILRIVP